MQPCLPQPDHCASLSTTLSTRPHSSKPSLKRQNAFAIPSSNWRKVRTVPHTTNVMLSTTNPAPLPGLPITSSVSATAKRGEERESKRGITVGRRTLAKRVPGKSVSGRLVVPGVGPILLGLLTPAKLVASNELQKNTPRGYYVTPKVPPPSLFL